MKHILITGGAGFIGSHLIDHFLEKYNYRIINLDKLTYAANLENLCKANDYDNYRFIKGDIGNRELIEHIFVTYDYFRCYPFSRRKPCG